MPYGSAVATAYASSTSTVFSGESENVSAAENRWSTLADRLSSDSAMLKLRGPGAMSPLGTKPASMYFLGSCDKLMYAPCSTAEIAGLNAAMPEAVGGAGAAGASATGADAGAGAGDGPGAGAAALSAAFKRSSSARMRASYDSFIWRISLRMASRSASVAAWALVAMPSASAIAPRARRELDT